MHLIIPFAASLSEPCQHALGSLPPVPRSSPPFLPNLQALLSRLRPQDTLDGDEYALSMPHERVLAAAFGWPADLTDGTLPWAAWWAAQDGIALPHDETWALLSPGHWLMGRDHLTLIDPEQLQLAEAESHALFDAILPFFESDGWALRFGAPTRWYLSHPSLSGLPTASLDRVIGRNPDVWLTDHPQARVLRRLQAEAQMLWYQHPLHDARQAHGLLPVNSFWVSGCGAVLGPVPGSSGSPGTALADLTQLGIQLDTRLRAPLLADDMPAWLQAWRELDAGPLAQAVQALDAGQSLRLTLCGERLARTWGGPTAPPRTGSLWPTLLKLTPGWRRAPAVSVTDVLTQL